MKSQIDSGIPVAPKYLKINSLHRFLLHAVHIRCDFHRTYNWSIVDKLAYNHGLSMFDFPSPNAVLEAENNCYFKVTQTSKTLGLRIGTPTANRKDPTGG